MTTLALYGQWVLTGVVEEKSNRVVELILSTVRSRHLLAGKVIGIGLLGLGQLALVAGLAAGQSSAYPSAAPNAPLVDVRTADSQGQSLESDVVAACDWILQHQSTYNIRVANLSFTQSTPESFCTSPLDAAVEQLWFHGIVVVTAAGNYAVDGAESGVQFAPGNDPFVITVGVGIPVETPCT